MQAEEAQSKLAERVESMGVSEEEKTKGKDEENEQERSQETNEALKDATTEDDSSMCSTSVFSHSFLMCIGV